MVAETMTATGLDIWAEFYGCRKHAQAADEVRRWWQHVAARDLVVCVCRCCTGPCPVDDPQALCKRCQPAGGE